MGQNGTEMGQTNEKVGQTYEKVGQAITACVLHYSLVGRTDIYLWIQYKALRDGPLDGHPDFLTNNNIWFITLQQ